MEMNLNNKKIHNGEERQFSMEQFIGIFPNAISDDLCSDFLEWYNEMTEHDITMSSMEEAGVPGSIRKDEVIVIPKQLPQNCFPVNLTQALWQNISECYNIYYDEYNIDRLLTSYSFKAHRVLPTGGYHIWHPEMQSIHEKGRCLVFMLYLNDVEEGGETEFLYQHKRIQPKRDRFVLWPAYFTHTHRGNPPLSGEKLILTGWVEFTA